MTEIIYPELSYVVQGIYMDVYRDLQPGLREELYEEAMTRDLERERLSPDRQKPFPVFYKDTQCNFTELTLTCSYGHGRIARKLWETG